MALSLSLSTKRGALDVRKAYRHMATVKWTHMRTQTPAYSFLLMLETVDLQVMIVHSTTLCFCPMGQFGLKDLMIKNINYKWNTYIWTKTTKIKDLIKYTNKNLLTKMLLTKKY